VIEFFENMPSDLLNMFYNCIEVGHTVFLDVEFNSIGFDNTEFYCFSL